MTLMHRRYRLAAVLFAATMLIGVSGVVAASPASAETAGTCSGSITKRKPLVVGGTEIAEIIVYYKSGLGGNNTACMYHRGPTYGVTTDSMVQLGECYANDCTYAFDGGQFMRDSGHYAKFAGPVRRTSTDGNCVVAEARITWRGQTHIWSTGRVGCP
ncbi:hypothetical protein [Actinophytocola algeriensis]|uniref:Secreted protein n=1 Tax=Actinophytocola algeriensis TaxID=1768010 RepID=A0A7W7QFD7_9PSEU|nr:hypothetical protein [Actinophytocola algeriensis]MBB4912635.1 hypothetical protein [Actinophytocola algeriensis]MBE1472031.1 hypothetical protein [Actinophytocola algeriensis]